MYVCMYARMHACMYVYIHSCIHIHIYVYAYAYVYVYAYAYIYILTYICMYVDTHTYGIETDRTPARSTANGTRCAAQRNRRSGAWRATAKWTAAVAAGEHGDGDVLGLVREQRRVARERDLRVHTLSCRRSFSPWPGTGPALARRWPGHPHRPQRRTL